ncbi:APC family permease [Mycolicibacterium sp. P9-64]|uniref:APC family permease n=1 Tax=Mycolicibacterium sp. P9-64 TaxID=2024612 RepID=UPI0015633595|nr:APC family permease [Mycolicibacterium sp. P9-64]
MTQSMALPGKTLTRQIAFLPLVGLIFFSTSGGPYGLEPLMATSGPGMGLFLLLLVPIIYGIPLAAITTELATSIPEDGGQYVWAKRGLGSFWGFQAGLLRWINSWVDMAIYPVLFASYLAILFPAATKGENTLLRIGSIGIDLHWLVGVVCVIVPLCLLNIRGARSVGDSTILFFILSIVPIVIMTVLGLFKLTADSTNPFSPFVIEGSTPLAAFGVGLAVVMWSYCGFDSIGPIAGEIKDPKRNIPKAMMVAMIIIIASYMLPLMAAMAVGGWESWEEGSFGDIAGALGGPALRVLVVVGGMFSVLGMYSSLLMSSSRTVYVLAQEHWAPASLGRTCRRRGTPVVAIVVSSLIYAVFSVNAFEELVVVDVFLINFLALLQLAALIALRIREPRLDRPAKIPGGWFGLALLGVPFVSSTLFLVYSQLVADDGSFALWLFAIVITLSTLAYIPLRIRRNKALAAFPAAHVDESRVDD